MRAIQIFRDPLLNIRVGLADCAGSPEVIVGIVDGLPDLAHPSLSVAAIDVLRTMIPPDTTSPDAHGTGVCSLIFGQDEKVRGIAPACTGLILPIFFGRGRGEDVRYASQLDLARALTFAIENGASVINVSAGQKTFTAEAETHLEQAIQRCAENRILIVAASGNDGCDCIHLPAAMPCVLAVGASGTDERPLPASNWGALYRRNGILAPGEDLTMATLDGGITQATGTSYAAAIVSGVAAVLLSIARAEGYKIDPIDVRQILMDSAVPCTLERDGACDRYLAGSLDTAAALAMLHRVGAASRGPGSKPATRSSASPTVHMPTASQTRGNSAMLDSIPDASTVASQPPPGLSPSDLSQSACACQTHDEEHDDIEPQGIAAAPFQSLRSPAIAQSGIASALIQQGCSCGGGKPPQIVYAIGSLWFDFGTEARYDAIVQQIGDPVQANNPTALFAFLRANPQFMSGITFILMQDQIPLYAIQPIGTFALPIYTSMLDALDSSITERGTEQRISLPGFVGGSARLMNGMNVPIVFPDLRGMYMWRSADLVAAAESLAANIPSPPADEAVIEFLNRVYYELRNLGISPQERAMNYAATNAYQARQAFADAAARNYALDSIQVVRSPICRPDSDCWDVKLQMFDPENERRAGRVYRYTVDVSEVIPVTVGPVRNWAVRLGA